MQSTGVCLRIMAEAGDSLHVEDFGENNSHDEELISLIAGNTIIKNNHPSVTVVYLPISVVTTSLVFAVKQRELFLPLQHPGEYPVRL